MTTLLQCPEPINGSPPGICGSTFQGPGQLADSVKATSFGKYLERKGGKGSVENLVVTMKGEGLMGLVRLASALWAYEDFAGEAPWASDQSAPGDWRAGLMTSGLVAADLIDLAVLPLRLQATRTALTNAVVARGGSAATVAALQGWVPVAGWLAAGIAAAALAVRFTYGVYDAKDEFEFSDSGNQRYVDMFRSLGFSDPQLKALLNNNRGAPDAYLNNHPGAPLSLSSEDRRHIKDQLRAIFKEGGVPPLHFIHALLDHHNVRPKQRWQFMLSLESSQMDIMVDYTHDRLNHDMRPDGSFDPAVLEAAKTWMESKGLWKAAYLGA